MEQIEATEIEKEKQEEAMNIVFARMQDQAAIQTLNSIINHLADIRDKHIKELNKRDEEMKQKVDNNEQQDS